jgi:hypothetical protein
MNVRLRLLAFALLFAPLGRGVSQISPGPLAKAHHELDGATSCAKCHGLHKEPMSQLCLDCHRDIAWGIEQRRGLHAREARTPCAKCHPDHAGVGFDLIAWPGGAASGFDHAGAGWALEGKHATAKCESCHAMKFRVSSATALSKRRGTAGWLGLETSCASCHRDDDVHRNALGASCENCHDSRAWKPAPRFDHAKSRYPLTGKHSDVACEKCHLAAQLGVRPNAEGKLIPLFKPVPFKECSACHADPHKGRLSPRCAECHTTRGFKVVDKTEFDHQLTRYPLAGKHRSVSCDACHGPNLTKRDPPFATCASCHADAHRGEATLAGKPADCAACHGVAGFAPSTFTVAQHRTAAFPLNGKHTAVACAACHTPVAGTTAGRAAKVVRIRVAFARCASCHADAHAGQVAPRTDGATCEACHSDAGWKPSTYSLASHATLRLPLEGRHAAIACADCHGASRRGLPSATRPEALGTAHVMLRVPEVECASCHADPHGGRYSPGGALPLQGGCGACHGARAFRPSTVDVARHSRFTFVLDGAHRATPCVTCHAEMTAVSTPTSTLLLAAGKMKPLQFDITRATTCAACHESPHGAQFSGRKDRGACEGCHGLDRFAPATRFDHDKDAAFTLTGAHAKVACAACHKPVGDAAGVKRIVYRPLSAKCESCHTADVAKRPA